MGWVTLYCEVDDFCKVFESRGRAGLLESGQRRRNRWPLLALSEIMTILIAFHGSHYRTFKHFYQMLLSAHRSEFPNLVSYQRFVELMPQALVPLCGCLRSRRGENTGIAFVDSTALPVCGNKRISPQSRFPRGRRPGTNDDGLVLRVQTAPHHQ